MKKQNKRKKWIKFRHAIVRNILYWTLGLYSRLKYGIKIERFKEQEKRPYLILFNHQTTFDQFFVGMSFRGPVYYLASEDLFSNGWVSSIIRYLVAPIPIKKQTTDVSAILNCMRVAREGGTIAIAPEGNRTYSGRTEYMSPSIVLLAKKLGLPIALYRIEGGYGVQPRWSDVVRKGKMRSYVSRVIMPEEYAPMTDDELFREISDGLYVDEANTDSEFKHRESAEYLERAIYVCPECKLSTFESHGDIIECKKCGCAVRYLKNKELAAVKGNIPFKFVAVWYDYQIDFVNSIDPREFGDIPMYRERVSLYEVIPYKKKICILKESVLSMFGDRVSFEGDGEDMTFRFEDASAFTVLGRNKLNIYNGGKIYQVKGGKRFNALKYVHIYHRYKNIVKGEENVKFLGL